MIITRTPLRISFVGGGSDLPSFYREEPGCVVSATIDKYIYVTVSPKFDGAIRAAYSVTENVMAVHQLQHDLIREALRLCHIRRGIEIHSIADIPAGTGLGSSSAFTVGLLKAICPDSGTRVIAHRACEIEIDRCRHPIGKQDQYAAAFGGVNQLRFLPDEAVEVQPIACDYEGLSAHLLLLYTGTVRTGDAGRILAAQQQERDDVRELVALVDPFASALAWGSFALCGEIMDWAWSIKRRFVGSIVDHWYAAALAAGAWGGKLCGAGGGGFLLFLAPPERHGAIVRSLGLRHVPIRLEAAGSQVVYEDQQIEGQADYEQSH